jgi:Ion channel
MVMVRLFIKPAVFLLSIFLMAGVYESMWTRRPDYFRVQSGVNLLPIDLVRVARGYSVFTDKNPLPDLLREQREDAAIKQILELYEKYRTASVLLSNEQADYETREKQDAQDYKLFEHSQWAQYQDFVDQRIARFKPQIEETQKQMRAILVAAGVRNQDELPAGGLAVQYSNLDVTLAHLELEKAKAEYEARDSGFHHLTDFQQQPGQRAYLNSSEKTEQLRKQIFAQQTSIDALYKQLYDAFVTYLDAAQAHLQYWDFLYFSVGAATTATFGDIAPNSTSVRMLVCLQVLGSIVFTGLMVNALANRSEQKAELNKPN